jgi:hypothetical protein
MEKLEDFVRTGKPIDFHSSKPIDFHSSMSPEQWAIYQDGMRDVAAGPAIELAKRQPVRKGATAKAALVLGSSPLGT